MYQEAFIILVDWISISFHLALVLTEQGGDSIILANMEEKSGKIAWIRFLVTASSQP
jgi:hypothetical protein